MANPELDFLEQVLEGKDIESNWLHFVATPDTIILMRKVQVKVQFLLDKAHERNPSKYQKRVVTSEVINYEQFANGESIVTLQESIRGKHVYLFSNPEWDANKESQSLNDKLIHDILALDAIKVNGARSINLVIPSIPYARQDKMTTGKRQSASFDRIWRQLSDITGENGYIMTIDLHNPASKSALQATNFINFYTGWFIKRVIDKIGLKGIILSTADQWWDKKISWIAWELWMDYKIVLKARNYTEKNTVDKITVPDDIQWKNILIHDDILDSGGTLVKLLEEMLKKKPKSIRIAITHGLFTKDAEQKLANIIIASQWVIKKIYITNSINKTKLPEWVEVIDCSDIFANNIASVFMGLPIERNNDKSYWYEPSK